MSLLCVSTRGQASVGYCGICEVLVNITLSTKEIKKHPIAGNLLTLNLFSHLDILAEFHSYILDGTAWLRGHELSEEIHCR